MPRRYTKSQRWLEVKKASIEQRREAQREYVTRWLNGEEDGLVKGGYALRISIRDYLLEKRGWECEECGWDKINPTTGRCPVEIDHIDGNHKNNRPENLRILCPNCHSLTATYRKLNVGNGRSR